ncbi:MAG: zinc-binding dehydrogenase, partial [Burkholderiales bacterium]
AGGADAPPQADLEEIRALKVRVAPDGAGLATIAGMVAKGWLKAEIARTFPLEQAGEAQELNRAGRTRGKIVLEIAAS